MKSYYVTTPDGVRSGPVDEASLRNLYELGIYSPDSLVWTEGMANWQPLSTVFNAPPMPQQDASGYPPPANGYASPANGYAPPANGYAPPANGYAPPANGYAYPSNGYAPPVTGYAVHGAGSGCYDTSAYDGPFKALSYAFSHLTTNGRATRKEYWMAYLGSVLIFFAAFVLMMILGEIAGDSLGEVLLGLFNLLWTVYLIAILVAFLPLSVRRLHDVGMSGWLLLICLIPGFGSVVLLVFACMDSTRGTNEYGPSVKYPD